MNLLQPVFTSRELLYKAARLTQDEFEGMKRHVDRGAAILEILDRHKEF